MPITAQIVPHDSLPKEIRRNPVLWRLAFVPVVLVAQQVKPEAHTLLFVLSVPAIVPLAALLSHTAALKQQPGTRLDLDQVEFCEMRHRVGGGMPLVERRAAFILGSDFVERGKK
jgi:hypothetical protein